MEPKIKDLSIEEFRNLLYETMESLFEEFLEDILALTSEEYLKSIEEARQDYREGRTKSFEEIFDV